MEEKPKTWGGKRKEGRNQSPKSFRIDNDLIEALKLEENANKFVNEAIREKIREKLEKK